MGVVNPSPQLRLDLTPGVNANPFSAAFSTSADPLVDYAVTFDVTSMIDAGLSGDTTVSAVGVLSLDALFASPSTQWVLFDDYDDGFGETTIGASSMFVTQTTSFVFEFTLAEAAALGDSTFLITLTARGPSIGSETRDDDVLRVTLLTCFAEGTLIATPEGEVPVETLGPGDSVLTQDGRAVPVHWLGRQTVDCAHEIDDRSRLIRFDPGVLGENCPTRPLSVTADHAICIGDYLINAAALVNGSGIDAVPVAELGSSYTVYHIETENHEVVLANGAPSESFVDAVTRSHFDNYQEYLGLYGADRVIPEMPTPRITSARLLPQNIRQRLGLFDFAHVLRA